MHALTNRHIRHLVPKPPLLSGMRSGALQLAFHASASLSDWAFFMGAPLKERGLYPMYGADGLKDDCAIAAIRDGNRDCVILGPVETTWDYGSTNPIVKKTPNQ